MHAKRDETPRRSGPATRLLAGGNPQVAKADGDAPVEAYLAAMPGWKQSAGRRLDGLIARACPGVVKAVRWNSPFYGVERDRWFAAFHCLSRSIKVTFFDGVSLDPVPPGAAKDPRARFLDIREGEEPDEERLLDWFRQASRLPGWRSATAR
jgi:hypothetical protein